MIPRAGQHLVAARVVDRQEVARRDVDAPAKDQGLSLFVADAAVCFDQERLAHRLGVAADALDRGVGDRLARLETTRAHQDVGAVDADASLGLARRGAEHVRDAEVGAEPADEIVALAEADAHHGRIESQAIAILFSGKLVLHPVEHDAGAHPQGARGVAPARGDAADPRARCAAQDQRGPSSARLARVERDAGVLDGVEADPRPVPRPTEDGVRVGGVVDRRTRGVTDRVLEMGHDAPPRDRRFRREGPSASRDRERDLLAQEGVDWAAFPAPAAEHADLEALRCAARREDETAQNAQGENAQGERQELHLR